MFHSFVSEVHCLSSSADDGRGIFWTPACPQVDNLSIVPRSYPTSSNFWSSNGCEEKNCLKSCFLLLKHENLASKITTHFGSRWFLLNIIQIPGGIVRRCSSKKACSMRRDLRDPKIYDIHVECPMLFTILDPYLWNIVKQVFGIPWTVLRICLTSWISLVATIGTNSCELTINFFKQTFFWFFCMWHKLLSSTSQVINYHLILTACCCWGFTWVSKWL